MRGANIPLDAVGGYGNCSEVSFQERSRERHFRQRKQ